jgi:hypothetical protein
MLPIAVKLPSFVSRMPGATYGRAGLFACLAIAAGAADDSATFRASSAASWPFAYEENVFGDDVVLDLRSLNERQAGEGGFVGRSADGNSFALADGTPLRFWAANVDTGLYYGPGEVSWSQDRDYLKLARRTFKPEILRQHARWLAKMGVNLVRLHVSLPPKMPGSQITDVNEPVLDEIFRIVAAMKEEGIYTAISPLWPHANFLNVDTRNWGLAGYETPSTWDSDTPLWGLVFFSDKLQAAYREWLRALYSRMNPYTGKPLSAEPAVAIIQLVNEDSLLFGTEPGIRPEQRAILAGKFTREMVARHGSLAAAQRHWGDAVLPQDTPELLQLLTMEEIRAPASPRLEKRIADQLQFYVETMRSFYADTARFLRDELGCRQLINAGNWRTIDDSRMLVAERYTYAANDVVGVNTYFASEHRGPQRGYRVNVGDTYRNMSALEEARLFPPLVKQVEGFPTFMSESAWVYPNFYQSEAPLLVAAYGAMSGIDAYAWHTFRAAPEYDTNILFLQNKWNAAHPALAAGFPAAALIFRRNLVKEARPVSLEHLAPGDLWRREPARFNEASGFDPNRDRESVSASTAWKDRAAFLVGPVRVAFDGSGPDSGSLGDLAEGVSVDGQKIRSSTGELVMDRARKILQIDAPQAQGAVGFLRTAGPIQLGQVRIQSDNDYAHVVVVALDGKPIASSDRLLVQGVTAARPTDWQVEIAADGLRTIKSLGHRPWRIERLRARVEVANAGLTAATVLDPMGRRLAAVELTRAPTGVAFDFPDNAFYVILSRDAGKPITTEK